MKRITTLLFTALVVAALCAAQTDPGYGGGSFRQEGVASWYGAEFAGLPTASGEAFNPADFTAAHPTLPFGTLLKITNRHNSRQVVVRVNDRGPFVPARIIDVSQAAAEQLDMIATGTAPVVVEMADQAGLAYTNTAPWTSTTGQQTVQQQQLPESDFVAPLAQASPPSAGSTAGSIAGTTQAQSPELLFKLPAEETPPPAAPAQQFGGLPVEAASTQTAAVRPAAAVIKPSIPSGGGNQRYRLQVGSYRVPRNALAVFDRLKQAGLSPAYERSGDLYRVVLAGVRAEEVPSIAEKLGAAGFTEAFIREER
ncbi:MAG: septal ring lytic transglycosylase RlpA family protein [Treponema sp.]|nr:septal ring lytic transglycosylase RlpA family protein [Treponema sp.]